MRKEFSDDAWEDYIYWETQDKKTLKRINKLIEDIERNGYGGIGKPERLSGNLSDYWSRRIDGDTLPYLFRQGRVSLKWKHHLSNSFNLPQK